MPDGRKLSLLPGSPCSGRIPADNRAGAQRSKWKIPLITRRSWHRVGRATRRYSSSLSQQSCFLIKASLDSEALNHNSVHTGIPIEYRP